MPYCTGFVAGGHKWCWNHHAWWSAWGPDYGFKTGSQESTGGKQNRSWQHESAALNCYVWLCFTFLISYFLLTFCHLSHGMFTCSSMGQCQRTFTVNQWSWGDLARHWSWSHAIIAWQSGAARNSACARVINYKAVHCFGCNKEQDQPTGAGG